MQKQQVHTDVPAAIIELSLFVQNTLKTFEVIAPTR